MHEPMTFLITEEMRSAVGSELVRQTAPPIAPSDVRRWALACYYPEHPPLRFLDGPEQEVPEEFNPFAWHPAVALARDPSMSVLDRLESGIGLPRVATSHGVHGGIRTRYLARMHVGQVLERVWTLEGYTEKQGRTGRLLFTVIGDRWADVDGSPVRHSELTIVRY